MNEETHNWTNNEVTLNQQRIIDLENNLAKINRELKSQIDWLIQESDNLNKVLTIQINKNIEHEKWLQICDNSIKQIKSEMYSTPAVNSKSVMERPPTFKEFIKNLLRL